MSRVHEVRARLAALRDLLRRDRLAEERFRLAVARNTRRDTAPPLPSAFAHFGGPSVIVPPARVNHPEHISVGDGVVVLEGAWLAVYPLHDGVAPRLHIGDRVRIGRFAKIACTGSITIGDDVLMSDFVYVADSHHAFDDSGRPVSAQGMSEPRPVTIGRGAFLGIRATVLEGVTIGENAYVGAGAVVTEDVPGRCVVVGNPARIVRRWDDATGEWITPT